MTADRILWDIVAPDRNSRPRPRDPRGDLLGAGVTVDQLRTLTGAGLRHVDGCGNTDNILHKYAAGALSLYGVMGVLYGTDSPEHHAGHALTV